MAELAAMTVVNGRYEFFEQPQPFRSDASFDDAAVVLLALAGDPAVFFHAIEEAGHIGIAGNHALGDPAAGKAFGFGTAKDAEDVVLSGSETGGFDDNLGLLREGVGEPEDGDEEVILERDGWALRHGHNYCRYNDYCQEENKAEDGNWRMDLGTRCAGRCKADEQLRSFVANTAPQHDKAFSVSE